MQDSEPSTLLTELFQAPTNWSAAQFFILKLELWRLLYWYALYLFWYVSQLLLVADRLIGLVVKASASRVADLGFESHLC